MKDIFEMLEKKEVYLTILAIIAVIFSFSQYDIIKDFKQAPACLYGCDLYNHVGKIYHLYDGGSFFRDGANPNVNPWVPSLHHEMVAVLAKITGWDVMYSYGFFTVIAAILCIIIVFFLFKMLFGKSLFGFLAVLLFLPLFPIWKYTPFVAAVFMPLFFLAFLYFFKKKTTFSAVLVGLSFGLVSLSSSNAFFAVVFFTAVAFFFMVVPELLKVWKLWHEKNKEKSKKFIHHIIQIGKSYILPFVIITLIGMSFAMFYWHEPIFRFHLHTTNMQSEFDSPDMSVPSVFMKQIYSLTGTFFSFTNLPTFCLMALSILGILLLFFVKSSGESNSSLRSFVLVSFLTAVIGGYNFVIVYPVFKMDLLSGWIYHHIYTTVKIMLILFCIFIVSAVVQKKSKKYSLFFNAVVLVIIAAISVAGVMSAIENFNNDKFAANAKNDLDPVKKEVQSWVRTNTNVNDIFLTTNENSFALNAITGRKMMTMRRSHSNQFLDFNQIMMDAAVILYGNNSELTKELLKKYNVKYFYWDYYWFNSEFQFDDKGQLVGFFDPLVTTDTKEHRTFLDENNVRYITKHWYIDPGVQYEGIKQYDLLFVLPSQFNQTKPWSDTFNQFITLKKDFKYDGTDYARIYSINTN